MTTTIDQKRYDQLKSKWVNLLRIMDTSTHAPDWAVRDEQQAWDEWVDWVEDNDLNGTRYDPRGPEDGDYISTLEWVR